LCFSATLSGGGEIVTFLFPRKPGIEWSVTETDGKERREFEVSAGNSQDTVIIPASGAWVWTRTTAGEVIETVCAALTE